MDKDDIENIDDESKYKNKKKGNILNYLVIGLIIGVRFFGKIGLVIGPLVSIIFFLRMRKKDIK